MITIPSCVTKPYNLNEHFFSNVFALSIVWPCLKILSMSGGVQRALARSSYRFLATNSWIFFGVLTFVCSCVCNPFIQIAVFALEWPLDHDSSTFRRVSRARGWRLSCRQFVQGTRREWQFSCWCTNFPILKASFFYEIDRLRDVLGLLSNLFLSYVILVWNSMTLIAVELWS